MTQLIFTSGIKDSISKILLAIRPYMKGLVYDMIVVKAEGKVRFELIRTDSGYSLFGCNLTPEIIKRRYS